MTRSLTKLLPDDLIEWPDGERATVTWVSDDATRFRVEGLPSLLRTADNFRVVRSGQLAVPD
jgi:hypothetical protein